MKSSSSSAPGPSDSVLVAGVSGSGTAPSHVLAGLMLARLLVLLVFLGVLSLVMPSDSIAFYTLMALAFIITVPYSLWLRDRFKAVRLAQLQFVVDLFVVTGLVYFTGGMQSDLTMLYPLVILSAGLVNPPRRALEITILCMLVYLIFSVMSYQGILVAPSAQTSREGWAAYMRSTSLRALSFCLFGLASVYLARRCSFLDQRASQYRDLAGIVLRNLPVGLVLVDDAGKVVLVNRQACRLLRSEEQSLVGKPFELESENEPDDADATAHQRRLLHRPDGSTAVVHVERSQVIVPPDVLGDQPEAPPQRLHALSFADVSDHVAAEEQLRDLVRLKTAARLASKMAHEICNPIAAISGGAQLLGRLRGPLAEDPQAAQLLEQIIAESDRTNQIISQFLTAAEFSTEEYRKAMETLGGDRPVTADVQTAEPDAKPQS